MLLMGIIPGTVKIRGIVVDSEGVVVAYRSRPSPLHYLENRQGAEFYADEVWDGVKQVIQGLTGDCPHPEEIAALSIASMEIGVALRQEVDVFVLAQRAHQVYRVGLALVESPGLLDAEFFELRLQR